MLLGRFDRRGSLRPGLSRWMHRDSPVMIRKTDCLMVSACLRNSQEQGLDLLADEAQAVPEVGAHGRLAVAVAAVDVVVAPVGELAHEGDERERGVEFLPDATRGLGVTCRQPDYAAFASQDVDLHVFPPAVFGMITCLPKLRSRCVHA